MIKAIGKAVALSVANTAHTAVTVGTEVRDQCVYATFLNTGATVIALRLSNDITNGAPTPVLATDGTASDSNIVLPASMTYPMVYATPCCPFSVSAIGSAAGPSIVYITPCQV